MGISRRNFLAGAIITGTALKIPSAAMAYAPEVQGIAAKFSAIRTMTGRFMQFESDGRQTEGTFSMARPGKIRFDYAAPATLRVIADGRSVAVHNTRLNTWNLYPLGQTPLKMILDDRLDLSDSAVSKVVEGEDTVSVLLEDKGMFGNSKVDVMFDRSTRELRQWIMTDAQGRETAVVVFDMSEGVAIPASTFRIPYSDIRTIR